MCAARSGDFKGEGKQAHHHGVAHTAFEPAPAPATPGKPCHAVLRLRAEGGDAKFATMPAKVFAALIHYPVTDKHGDVVATSITNLDIHDIARASRTYGIERYYLVTPIEAQHWLTRRIIAHWEGGWGTRYNPNRKQALGVVEVKADMGEVAEDITSLCGAPPIWVATSARKFPNTITFAGLRERIAGELDQAFCLVFGTGHGLHPELVLEADLILEPIYGPTEYNHLSVRSAASVIFDRLLGRP